VQFNATNANQCKPMQANAANASQCKQMQVNTSKYKQMQTNARKYNPSIILKSFHNITYMTLLLVGPIFFEAPFSIF